jgi:ketosteroid isomerase-like protein
MMDRETILDVVDRAYAARQRGDKEALRDLFAPNAVFRIVGQSQLMGGLDVGPADALTAIDGLVDLFQFHRMERVQVVVDDPVVMIHWAVETSSGGGPRVETELCDIWTLDENDKVTSILEFGDTALISHMLASRPA